MRFALFVLAWILGLTLLDAFAFAGEPSLEAWRSLPLNDYAAARPDQTLTSFTQPCPAGTICPVPSAAPRVQVYSERRPVVRATGRVMRGGCGVLRGAGRVLTFPLRVFRGRGC